LVRVEDRAKRTPTREKESSDGLSILLASPQHRAQSRDEKGIHIVDKSNTFYMDMFIVKGILQQFNDIVADSMLGGEGFSPRKNFSRVERGLLDRE
jgi:hypothetical protein